MRVRALLVPLTASFLILLAQIAHAGTGGFWRNDGYKNLDAEACSPPFSSRITARLYSYQVPVLIRNERTPGEAIWAYADACTKEPDSWVPGQWIDWGMREGRTWASISIYRNPPNNAWRATFPPNEAVRNTYSADDLSSFGLSDIYVPVFGEFHGLNPPVSLATSPQLVTLGVPENLAGTLQEAGMIVEAGRVWAEYSTDPLAREGRNLKPYKVMRRWVPAYNLLCDAETGEKRTGNNIDLARTLMIRNPAFPFELADDFNCFNSHDKDQNGLRKWGGGILVYHLFPNLQMAPLEVTTEAGVVETSVSLTNHSAAAGPVHLFYRWDSTGT